MKERVQRAAKSELDRHEPLNQNDGAGTDTKIK